LEEKWRKREIEREREREREKETTKEKYIRVLRNMPGAVSFSPPLLGAPAPSSGVLLHQAHNSQCRP
jgi:hypothetical protein